MARGAWNVPPTPPYVVKTAELSEDGLYRYRLTRSWGPGLDGVMWVMLNPSTADASVDDPTIRRCMGFSQRWGYSYMVVLNLFALRTPDPRNLWVADDPLGPENSRYLAEDLEIAEKVVVAWGGGIPREWIPVVVGSFLSLASDMDQELWCLGKTVSGAPKHPLYLPGDTALQLW